MFRYLGRKTYVFSSKNMNGDKPVGRKRRKAFDPVFFATNFQERAYRINLTRKLLRNAIEIGYISSACEFLAN